MSEGAKIADSLRRLDHNMSMFLFNKESMGFKVQVSK